MREIKTIKKDKSSFIWLDKTLASEMKKPFLMTWVIFLGGLSSFKKFLKTERHRHVLKKKISRFKFQWAYHKNFLIEVYLKYIGCLKKRYVFVKSVFVIFFLETDWGKFFKEILIWKLQTMIDNRIAWIVLWARGSMIAGKKLFHSCMSKWGRIHWICWERFPQKFLLG